MHIAVTGASSGIGESIVREFAKQNANITLVARRKDRMDQIAAELDCETHVAVQDLSDLDYCCNWIEPAEDKLGPIDIIVNNAGMQVVGNSHEIDTVAAEKLMRLNVMAPFRITQQLLKKMRKRGSGVIVNIASVAAFTPVSWMYNYSASKAAIGAGSESLRRELRGTGVHVVTVYPGIISETEMGLKGLQAFENTWSLKMQADGKAKELALLIRKAVENKKARVVYPFSNHFVRYFPAVMRWAMDKFSPALKKT